MRARPWVVAGVGWVLVLGGCASGGSPSGKAAQRSIYATVKELPPGPGAPRSVPVPDGTFPPMSRSVIEHVLGKLPCTGVDGPQTKEWPGEGNGWSATCRLGNGDRFARVLSASAPDILQRDAVLRTHARSPLQAVVRPKWSVVCDCTATELAQIRAIR